MKKRTQSLCVENGLEAIEKVRQYCPDLIITDVIMPGMDENKG